MADAKTQGPELAFAGQVGDRVSGLPLRDQPFELLDLRRIRNMPGPPDTTSCDHSPSRVQAAPGCRAADSSELGLSVASALEHLAQVVHSRRGRQLFGLVFVGRGRAAGPVHLHDPSSLYSVRLMR